MSMAQEERAQIVQYLRDTQAIHERHETDGYRPLVSKHHADSCKWAAEAILRGEHWTVVN